MEPFDPASAYSFMEKLVKNVGNRESGTDSERKAAEQINSWFEQFGLSNIRMEEFEVHTSRILKEEAFLPNGTKIECTAVGNSLSTPPEGVEGDVVMLESTAPEALESIKGKIVALNLILYEKEFYKVLRAEPLALIYPSRAPLAPAIYRSIKAEFTEKQNVPAVSMAHDDVLNILKGPKKVKIVTQVEKIKAKSQNVIGEISGALEDEDVLIGGHYDTVRTVMGAHDNAAGTAIAIEFARTFAKERLNRTLRVAAFGSEELGLRGSFHHAENPKNLENLRIYLNFDVHGILLGTLSATIFGPDDLKSLMRFAAKELGIPVQITSELTTGGSDHMPMSFYGVPSVSLSRTGGAAQIMHTSLEDLRWCGPDGIAPVGKLSQTLLERLLKGVELPFEKEIPSDVAKALEKRFQAIGIRKKVIEEHKQA